MNYNWIEDMKCVCALHSTEELEALKSAINNMLADRKATEIKSNNSVENNAELTIWVDGSYDPATGAYAYGAVVDDGVVPKYYRKKFPAHPEMSTMRNVAGEIEGARFAIATAIKLGTKSCHIVYDYKGIEAWATKAWKANKNGTKAYAEFFDKYKDSCTFTFEHVKGHTGVKYNEYCDVLAKSVLGIAYAKKYNDIVEKAITN